MPSIEDFSGNGVSDLSDYVSAGMTAEDYLHDAVGFIPKDSEASLDAVTEKYLDNLLSKQNTAEERAWLEQMSNTSHQREVADLKAAGLNPWLSAGNGASTPGTSAATISNLSSSEQETSKRGQNTQLAANIAKIVGSVIGTAAMIMAMI